MKNINSTLVICLIFCALILGCGLTLCLQYGEDCSLNGCLGLLMILYVMAFPFLMCWKKACRCSENEKHVVDEKIKADIEDIKSYLHKYDEGSGKMYQEMKKVYENCFNHLTKYQSISEKRERIESQNGTEK